MFNLTLEGKAFKGSSGGTLAIQNFLSGGFYGKVGDVVGQRWHNKRFIRSYVIPFNPQTELQQSNREQFALATKLAQVAYNINKGSPLWDTTEMGQFSQMVSLAKRRLQAGKTPAEAIPLYPDGYSPNITLSQTSVSWSSWPTSFTISDNSYTFQQDRKFLIEFHCKDELTGNTVFISRNVTISAGSKFSYTFTNDNIHSFPSGSSVQAVTTDDSSHASLSIQFPVLSITQSQLAAIALKFIAQSVSYDSTNALINIHWLTANFIRYVSPPCIVHAYRYTSNAWIPLNSTITSQRDGTAITSVPTGNLYSYPVGSKVESGSYALTTISSNIVITWDQFDFSYP